jgi:uncharacterized protein
VTDDRTGQLVALVRSSGWLMAVLATVRSAGPADSWVGAGVLRDLVWSERFGAGFEPDRVRDVDVAFHDPTDLSRERDAQATAALGTADPSVPWEATNQAAVHTWYPEFFGDPAEPLASVADAVGTWPETATSVAVRLTGTGGIAVCAPLGLADLLDGVWRRNPRRVGVQRSRERLARHRPERRWPGVTVVEP